MKLIVTDDNGAEAFSYDTARSECLFPSQIEAMSIARFVHEALGFLIGVRFSAVSRDPFPTPPLPPRPGLRIVKDNE